MLATFFHVQAFGQIREITKPNVLIILTDDQGYHDASYQGAIDLETPNIDALVSSGTRFDNFYANSPVCSPSRASLLSGRYPEMVGVPGVIRDDPVTNFGYMDPNVRLLPELLKESGYHTALIGKWHLGLESPNLPNDRGFDYFQGFISDMMDDYWTHERNGTNFMRKNEQVIDPKGHATDLFTDWAVNYIGGRAKKKEPFFLYLAYNAPHSPIQPPKEWLDRVRQKHPGLSERRANLVALIEHLDNGIGEVIQALKESGQYENTLVVFCSDNGGSLRHGANNGSWRGGKTDTYEGGVRVPAAFSWPAVIKQNSWCQEKAIIMDIFPTVCQVAGINIEHKIDGVGLYPLLTGMSDHLPDRPLFFIQREGNLTHGGETVSAVIEGDWKLVKNESFQPFELFNLYQDPQETEDRRNENLEVYERMFRLMTRQVQRGGSVPWQKPEK